LTRYAVNNRVSDIKDSVIRVASPDGVAFDLHPAGAMVRIIAYIVDMFLQSIGAIVIAVILSIFKISGNWVIYLAMFAMMWFYMVIFELLIAGRTPGKLIMGLQVVLGDGSPITIPASLLRNLLRAFDFFFGIGFIVPLLNNGFRRLGDIVAGTLVVYSPERLVRMTGKTDFSGIEPVAPEHILGHDAADVILSFAQRRKYFSPQLREELAKTACEVYLFNPPEEGAEKSALGIAAWYAGMRPGRKNDT
jgi:uncharacterized RDD family membrane protein YckC